MSVITTVVMFIDCGLSTDTSSIEVCLCQCYCPARQRLQRRRRYVTSEKVLGVEGEEGSRETVGALLKHLIKHPPVIMLQFITRHGRRWKNTPHLLAFIEPNRPRRSGHALRGKKTY
jgi:hypothetical protein